MICGRGVPVLDAEGQRHVCKAGCDRIVLNMKDLPFGDDVPVAMKRTEPLCVSKNNEPQTSERKHKLGRTERDRRNN